MTSRKTRQRQARRERRLAKASGYSRSPKNPKRKGHGSSLADLITAPLRPRMGARPKPSTPAVAGASDGWSLAQAFEQIGDDRQPRERR